MPHVLRQLQLAAVVHLEWLSLPLNDHTHTAARLCAWPLQYNDICWKGAPDSFDKLESVFPVAEMVFGSDARLRLTPLRYLFMMKPGEYCLGFFDNGNAGTLVGGVSVRNVLVQVSTHEGNPFLRCSASQALCFWHRLGSAFPTARQLYGYALVLGRYTVCYASKHARFASHPSALSLQYDRRQQRVGFTETACDIWSGTDAAYASDPDMVQTNRLCMHVHGMRGWQAQALQAFVHFKAGVGYAGCT